MMRRLLPLLICVGLLLGSLRPAEARPLGLLSTGLIAYWKLDEASGTRNDSHGANHLTDNNTVGQASPGKLTDAALFVAANSENLSRADNADLSTGDIDFSVAGWVYLASKGANRPIASKWGAAGNREWQLRFINGSDRFEFLVSADGTNTGATATANNFGAPALNTWYYVVAWHDSVNDVVGISVNDGTPNTASYSSGAADRGSSFLFGYVGTGSQYWDGQLDGFGFWKKVLSPAEITLLYNGGAGCDYPFPCEGGPTDTPTATDTPTPTDTPVPPTDTPTHTPTPSDTPTITLTPSETPTPTDTLPGPTDTPTETHTPAPPTDTHTPAPPTDTPTPTLTPVPGECPTPEGDWQTVYPLTSGNCLLWERRVSMGALFNGGLVLVGVGVVGLRWLYQLARGGQA